jgi:proline iminopeptidase
MYGDNFEATIQQTLEGYFKQTDKSLASDLGMDLSEDNLNQDSSAFAAIMYHQIACQEMGLGNPMGGWASYFEGRKLVPSGNEDAPSCLELTGMKDRMGYPYSADRFPLAIPVTYIQGETDGATPLVGALQHFKLVAKGQSQFLMAPKGGHTPALESLNEAPDSPYQPGRRRQVALLVESALRGEKISAEQAGTVGWKLKTKL